MKTYGKRICPVCGKEFEATTAGNLICSKECRKKRNNQLCSANNKRKRMAEAREKERENHVVDYGSANMNAIAEIARNGVNYGQQVAERYKQEMRKTSVKKHD